MFLLDQSKTKWKNWSGHQKCTASIIYPKTAKEVSDVVKEANRFKKTVRAVGSGHSFSNLIANKDVILDLKNMAGLIEISKDKSWAHFYAGSILKDVNSVLFDHGLALNNLGDVDVQTLAGATATGTHGTGRDLNIISEDIIEVTFVNGLGEIKTIGEDSPEILQALKLNLGVLGIIISLKIRTISAYKLECKVQKYKISDLLKNFDELSKKHRNFEFFWFPYTEYAQLKTMDVTQKPVSNGRVSRFINDVLLENIVFGLIVKLTVLIRSKVSFFSKLCAFFISPNSKVDWSHRIYATPRLNRFNEMEFSVPIDRVSEALAVFKKIILRHNQLSIIPVEVRTVKKDNITISPAHGRNSVYIAVHSPVGENFKECFSEIESALYKLEGRPHWGKLSQLDGNQFKDCYPMAESFIGIRKKCDPNGIFLNKWTKNIFIK